MRKSLGSKRKELSPEHIEEITRMFGEFREAEKDGKPISRIFRNEDFGYRTITVERPQSLSAAEGLPSAEGLPAAEGDEKGKVVPVSPAPTGHANHSPVCILFRVAFRLSAPTGHPNSSPGQRPRYGNPPTNPSPEGATQPMPQSLARVHIHLIFSTKNRNRCLTNDVRPSLHAYMATVLRNLGCPAVLINSFEDHVHILFELARTVSVAGVVEEVKKTSSKWIKTQEPEFAAFAWQSGYGAFAVSESNVEAVRQYIADQEEHHRKKTFQDEYRTFLARHRIEYDERYVWDQAARKYLTSIRTGYTFSSDDFVPTGVPVLRIGDISVERGVDFSEARFLSEEYLTEHSEVRVTRDDMAISSAKKIL